MGDLMYYVSGRSTVTHDLLSELQLDYIVPHDKSLPDYVPTARGCDERSGIYFAYITTGKLPDFTADENEWKQIKESVWVGCNTKDIPSPETLERSNPHRGHKVVLSDGNEWMVPVVRYLEGESPLPSMLQYNNESKKWENSGLRRQYKDIFERACDLWDEFIKAKNVEDIIIKDGYELASDALALNYRISRDEISVMQLFDTVSAQDACLAVVDYPTWEAFIKKNPGILEPGEQDSTHGD